MTCIGSNCNAGVVFVEFIGQTFEGMIECNEKALKEAEEERRRALAAADGLRQELRAARQTANEEKSLKLFSESRLRDVEGRLRALEADGDARTEALKAQASEYAAVIRRLTDQVRIRTTQHWTPKPTGTLI